MFTSAQAPVAIAAITQDRALIGLLRSVVDPTSDLIIVNSEGELTPHLNSRRVSVALLDSMFIEGDLAAMAERLRDHWNDLVLVVVGTAEEQSKVASQITSGVVYRFLHRPVSAPRVRLFVEAALRRHEVENDERTLEQMRPDFSRFETPKSDSPRGARNSALPIAIGGLLLAAAAVGGWYLFSRGKSPAQGAATAQVVSPTADAEPRATPAQDPAAPAGQAEQAQPELAAVEAAPAPAPAPAVPEPSPEPAAKVASPPPAEESVADRLRQAASPEPASAAPAPGGRVQRTTETAVENAPPPAPPPPPALTHEERVAEQLAKAEAALQRGDLAKPAGKNAVELFRGALELDPSSTLAKAGLVRVADRLLASAERSLTAGNAGEARKMVDIAETLTPATARAAFLTMQIEKEQERAALVAKRDSDAQDKLEKGPRYIRLAGARLRSGALISPSQDNARFYIEAARQVVPEDPALGELSRSLQKELLTRASAAATAGNASETERWLAYADSADAPRADIANVRRMLQGSLLGVRSEAISTLAQSFNKALAAGQLLQPADACAKSFLFELIKTDGSNPAVATARQGLGQAYLRELRAALARNDIGAADGWLQEAHTISFASTDLNAATTEVSAARERAAQASSVVGANSLARVEYVAPKFPTNTRNREMNGWVELEFTVRTDGSTSDIVVTNSYPRKMFDASATRAVSQWRYKPVMRAGKPVDQRAAVRIRFSDE